MLDHKPTLYRKTATAFQLKRPTSRQVLSEVKSRFGSFLFSSRQLSDQKTAAFGLLECTRNNVLRQYEVLGEKDGKPTSREFGVIGESSYLPSFSRQAPFLCHLGDFIRVRTHTDIDQIAINKKAISRITTPPPIDLEKVKSDKKIEDEEILKLLEMPLGAVKK